MKPVLSFILFIAALVCGLTASADEVRQGYTQDVQAERSQDYYEIYLIPPYQPTKSDYRGVIFNHQLTVEFRQKYIEKFGYIDNNSLSYSANKFIQLDENRPVMGVETLNKDRRAYGEYMMRRLGEWHLDNFVKSEPSVRPLYEAKERLSNVQVEVGKQTRAKMTYSISDNSAEVVVENPYCDSKLRIEMDPTSFGPGAVVENRLYVGKRLNQKHYLNSYLADKDGVALLELQKTITPSLGTSYSVSQPFRSEGLSVRETRVGAGLIHTF